MKYTFLRNCCLTVATGAGIGRVPYAPGTCATAITIASMGFLSLFSCWSWPHTLMLLGGFMLVAYISILFALPLFGNDTDPSAIVIDEVVGTLVTFLGITLSWRALFVGFLLFRFFDILKPCGIKQAEQVGGAAGIMADDIVAGLYANALLHLYIWLFV